MKKRNRLLLWLAILAIPLSVAWAANNFIVKTDGMHIGTKATDKLAAYDVTTAIVQPAATVATRKAMQNIGFIAGDGTITATASAGTATLSKTLGVVTSEVLTTAGLAAYTLTLTNTTVAATSVVTASLANGTNTQGTPSIGLITPGSGSVVITVNNLHASQALNGTIKISFVVNN